MHGGELTYAPGDNGTWATNIELNTSFAPKHNSMYMIFGSYVQHAVRELSRGKRIVVVMMFKLNVSFKKMISMWGKQPIQCNDCYLLYKNVKSLNNHHCEELVPYSRFKDGEYIFDSEKKKSEELLYSTV